MGGCWRRPGGCRTGGRIRRSTPASPTTSPTTSPVSSTASPATVASPIPVMPPSPAGLLLVMGWVWRMRGLARRLERVAAGYERRHYRLFGYPGSSRDWAEELAEPLVASELAVAAGMPPATARAWVNAAVALFVEDRLP